MQLLYVSIAFTWAVKLFVHWLAQLSVVEIEVLIDYFGKRNLQFKLQRIDQSCLLFNFDYCGDWQHSCFIGCLLCQHKKVSFIQLESTQRNICLCPVMVVVDESASASPLDQFV